MDPNEHPDKKAFHNRMTPVQWVLRMIQGAMVGIAAILPGLSGGVLAVIFGIYEPMMELLSHPVEGIKKHYRIFLPISIGWVLGFVFFAKLMGNLLDNERTECITHWLFIGLIVGTMPSLYKEAGKEGRPKSAWIAFAITVIGALTFMLSFQYTTGSTVSLDILWQKLFWFFFCGLLWALSLVAPGMSSSSILIYLGLLQPLSEGIGSLNLIVLLPFISGILLGAFSLARLVNYLFKNHYPIVFHVILGFVIASTIVIVPVSYHGAADVIFCILTAIIGFFAAISMERLNKKLINN